MPPHACAICRGDIDTTVTLAALSSASSDPAGDDGLSATPTFAHLPHSSTTRRTTHAVPRPDWTTSPCSRPSGRRPTAAIVDHLRSRDTVTAKATLPTSSDEPSSHPAHSPGDITGSTDSDPFGTHWFR